MPLEHEFLPTPRIAYFEVADWIESSDASERICDLLSKKLSWSPDHAMPSILVELLQGISSFDFRLYSAYIAPTYLCVATYPLYAWKTHPDANLR